MFVVMVFAANYVKRRCLLMGVLLGATPLVLTQFSLLLLLCSQATEEYLEWFKRNRQQPSEAAAGADGATAGADVSVADKDAAAENEALGRVMGLISQRPEVAGPKVEPSSAAAAADSFLSSLAGPQAGSERTGGSSDRKRDRDVERESEREAERERQRQRREEQRREEAAERAYRDAVRQWEDHER